MGERETLKRNFNILILATLGLLLRLLLYKTGTFVHDFNTFIAWSNILNKEGFGSFYTSVWSDYLPGYLYILWVLAKIKEISGLDTLLLYKLPAIIADVATAVIIYFIVAKLKDRKWGLFLSAFYLLNPAILANSTFWGQVDSLTSLASILSISLVSISPVLSGVFLAAGTLIKPQVAMISPVIFFLMLKERWKSKDILTYALVSASIFTLGFLPFAGGKNLIVFIFERIGATVNQYPFASVNAFNFWGLWGFWTPDGAGLLSPKFLGILIFGVVSSLSLISLYKTRYSRYLLSAIIFSSGFFFLTRMHERHLLPAFAPLVIAASGNPLLLVPYFGWSTTYVLNLFYSYGQATGTFAGVFFPLLVIAIIALNLVFFIILLSASLKEKIPPLNFLKQLVAKDEKATSLAWIKKRARLLFLLIMTFALVTRFLYLAHPEKEYFDEVYHAFTARRILHGDPKAWEWWNDPPEGFAYEWTHPPLAKLGMVLGMKLFGENSFGWRFPGALLGVGSVLIVYGIAKTVFRDDLMGILSGAIFALDGLPLVMSRIGMNDSYFLFFVLASIYFFLKERNFLSAFCLGLAAASKWSTVWAIPILIAAHILFKRKIRLSYLWFFLLPPALYLASYIPMFLTGHSLETFMDVQKQMWWYHTNLKATHAYTSPWFSWPIMARPIYLYTSEVVSGYVSKIYAMGNPFIFWPGLLAIILGIVQLYKLKRGSSQDSKEERRKLGFVIFSYLVFFVPWAASPRIMFLYHYLPSLPFLAIVFAWFLRQTPKLTPYFLVSSVLVFIYFYPHWNGISVPLWLDKSYYWFSSWL